LGAARPALPAWHPGTAQLVPGMGEKGLCQTGGHSKTGVCGGGRWDVRTNEGTLHWGMGGAGAPRRMGEGGRGGDGVAIGD